MANLITNHDPYHVHKILGVAVLLHYLYRFFLLLHTGTTSFPEDESRLQSSFWVSLHGILSLSSLLLPLPQKRNFGSPLIWPEFRFHSIVFAMRHVVCTLFTINGFWPETLLLRTFAKISVVIMTSRMAAMVTASYGCNDKRTTNSMPYPSGISVKQQKHIKFQYAKAQFAATVSMLEDDPTRNFWPILAIQMAPLLMTLVRKGKVSSMTYHRVYMLSLHVSYIAVAYVFVATEDVRVIIFFPVLEFITIRARIKYGFPHWFLWTVHGVSMLYVYPLFIHQHLVDCGVAAFLLRYKVQFSLVPLGRLFVLLMSDPRPLLESVKHWPFLKTDKDISDTQYFMKPAMKRD